MNETEQALSESAFLAEIDASERNPLRILATLAGGLGGGFLVGLLFGAIVLAIYVTASGPLVTDPTILGARVSALLNTASVSLTSTLTVMTLAAATNGPWAATFLGIAALINRRRIRDYLTAAPRFRWRLIGAGLVLSAIALAPVVAIGQLTDPHAQRPPVLALTPDLSARVLYVVASVALLIPAAAAEEALFRGWLLRQTGAFTRNPILLMAINGVLFSAVHGEFAPDPFLTRALMGAGFVYMTLRLGGIEFSIGAHAANNILIVLFIEPLTLKASQGGGVSLDSMFQQAFLFASYVAMAEVTARWAPLRRWSGADRALPAPATLSGPWS